MLLQEQAAQGINKTRQYQKTEDRSTLENDPGQGCKVSIQEEQLGSGRDSQTTPPTTECGVLQWLHPKEIQACAHQCHRPQLRGAGRHSPEMRLAMVLVGTNRVLSTPSIFAAFSCSSEMEGGRWARISNYSGYCTLAQFCVYLLQGMIIQFSDSSTLLKQEDN